MNADKEYCTDELPMKCFSQVNTFIKDQENPRKNQNQESIVRSTWSRKAEYLLSLMGYCIGLGHIIRFPYLCIRNGGSAFLIPYLIILVLCGLPLFLMEVALGQFMANGVYHVWSICPLFKGIGIGQIIVNVICAWYYVTMTAYILIYLVSSFRSTLPWTLCGQSWNSPQCVPHGTSLYSYNSSDHKTTSLISVNQSSQVDGHMIAANGSEKIGNSKPASEEFWIKNVLELSSGLDDPGGLPWHTAMALLAASLLMLVCIIKGVKSVGKVVYVTATFPYILLTILTINGATLPGAVDGILLYVTPDFSKLTEIQTWLEACFQVFYALGPIWGGLVTMSSYNKFHNNCIRDSMLLPFICAGTSVFAGFAIFPVLGHMAHNLKVPVETFTATGPSLAFVVYPEAVAYLPLPQLWAILFFLMLLSVGMDTQFVAIEVVMTSLMDFWPRVMRKWEVIVKIIFICVQFLFGLSLVTRGGMYVFQLVDWYIAAVAVSGIGFSECIAVAWIYGTDRFMGDIHLMTGKRVPYIYNILWRFITPTLLLILLVASMLLYQPITFEGYTYGDLAVTFGWIVAISWFIPIPIMATVQLIRAKGNMKKRLMAACTPSTEWQPSDVTLRKSYRQMDNYRRQPCSLPRPKCLL